MWRVIVAGLMIAAAIGPPEARAESRVALVIGASAYKVAPPLRNTLNDARGIQAALNRLGFQTEAVLDPDRAELEAAVRRFGEKAAQADVALFYYAGHAVEVAGRNWLLPVSADIRSARDLRFEATELDSVLEQLEGAARLSVVILDSCRENPFRMRLGDGSRGAASQGMARVQAALGALVVFATAPGTVAGDGVGPNSPFTTALLKRIETPGAEIRQVMADVRRDVREATKGKQIPWEQSAMEGSLYLKPAAPAAVTSPAVDADAMFWDSVRASSAPADLRAYLARFPDGTFAGLARTRLSALATPSPPPPDPPPPAPPSGNRTAPTITPAAAAPPPAIAGPPDAAARLAGALSFVPAGRRADIVSRYLAAPGVKALAYSPEHKSTWWNASWNDAATAETKSLEGCQAFYGTPCALLARGDETVPPPASGNRPTSDMPNLHYVGAFDPQRIPVANAATLRSAVVTGYRASAAPKAMAFHPWGRVFSATAAATQEQAEAQALASCNADPSRNGRDGPCLLYAAGDEVVLPLRAVASVDAPYARIGAAARSVAYGSGDLAYASAQGPKAMALHVQSGRTFRWDRVETPELAAEKALEACQQQQNSPCILLAVGEVLQALDVLQAKPRDMPKLHYRGPFKLEMVPFLRIGAAIREYPGLAGPKALAVRPSGARAAVQRGATQAEANRLALASCNEDDSVWPCFLYASGNDVVLPDRRTEAP